MNPQQRKASKLAASFVITTLSLGVSGCSEVKPKLIANPPPPVKDCHAHGSDKDKHCHAHGKQGDDKEVAKPKPPEGEPPVPEIAVNPAPPVPPTITPQPPTPEIAVNPAPPEVIAAPPPKPETQ